MTKTYLSGPMAGYPEYNYPAFKKEAQLLRSRGIDVEDPSDNYLPEGSPWSEWMKLALIQMAKCNSIHMLEGHSKSRGATLELLIARELGYSISYQNMNAEYE